MYLSYIISSWRAEPCFTGCRLRRPKQCQAPPEYRPTRTINSTGERSDAHFGPSSSPRKQVLRIIPIYRCSQRGPGGFRGPPGSHRWYKGASTRTPSGPDVWTRPPSPRPPSASHSGLHSPPHQSGPGKPRDLQGRGEAPRPDPSGGRARRTAAFGARGEMRAEVNGLVVTQAGPSLPATLGPQPKPESGERPGTPRGPGETRSAAAAPRPRRLAGRRGARGGPGGDDAPRAATRRGSARPHPAAAAGAPRWLTRGSGGTRTAVLPERPGRKKPSAGCSPSSVEGDTARRPVPSCVSTPGTTSVCGFSRAPGWSALGPVPPRQPGALPVLPSVPSSRTAAGRPSRAVCRVAASSEALRCTARSGASWRRCVSSLKTCGRAPASSASAPGRLWSKSHAGLSVSRPVGVGVAMDPRDRGQNVRPSGTVVPERKEEPSLGFTACSPTALK